MKSSPTSGLRSSNMEGDRMTQIELQLRLAALEEGECLTLANRVLADDVAIDDQIGILDLPLRRDATDGTVHGMYSF